MFTQLTRAKFPGAITGFYRKIQHYSKVFQIMPISYLEATLGDNFTLERPKMQTNAIYWLLLLGVLASCGPQTSMSGGASRNLSAPTVEQNGQTNSDAAADGANKGDQDDLADGDDPDNPGADDLNGNSPNEVDVANALKALPKFAMSANHFECGFCHVHILGDIVSRQDVEPVRNDSEGKVIGNWRVRGNWRAKDQGAKITVTGKIDENANDVDIPTSSFKLDFAKIKPTGTLSWGSEKVSGRQTGSKIVTGTESDPIVIKGEVVIEGDLVISGRFRGVGSIYVTGSILVPHDLRALNSPFPFSENSEAALGQAEQAAKDSSRDGLGLAAKKSIFAGNLDSGVIGHETAPVDSRKEAARIKGMLKTVNPYKQSNHCVTGRPQDLRSFEVIDAFLYAGDSIEGKATNSSFSIRGGIFTDYYHILNGAGCVGARGVSSAHERLSNRSYVEYDWRLQTGKLRVLESLGRQLKGE
jgi:hypothetical protein